MMLLNDESLEIYLDRLVPVAQGLTDGVPETVHDRSFEMLRSVLEAPTMTIRVECETSMDVIDAMLVEVECDAERTLTLPVPVTATADPSVASVVVLGAAIACLFQLVGLAILTIIGGAL